MSSASSSSQGSLLKFGFVPLRLEQDPKTCSTHGANSGSDTDDSTRHDDHSTESEDKTDISGEHDDSAPSDLDEQATEKRTGTNRGELRRSKKPKRMPYRDSAKRVRMFKVSWKKAYPSVVHDDKKKIMQCTICNEFPTLAGGNSFVTGTASFRVQNLRAHNTSKQHHCCVKEAKEARDKPRSAPMNVLVRNMEAGVREKMVKLFNIAFFVAKEEIAFAKFPSLCALHIKNDVELGQTYFNDHACRAFVDNIAGVMMDSLSTKLKKERFFSVMCDGSTDSADLEQELMYVRFLQGGIPINLFLSVQALRSGDAPGICNGLDAAFQHAELSSGEWRDRLVGFGADRAAVMLGRSRGVAALLQEDVPHMVEIHCVAHRLELGILDATKQETVLSDVKEMLKTIYKHYHYSPKALCELRAVAEALEMKVLKPVNILGTRWVSHMPRALEVLLRDFQPIFLHFQHTIEARSASADMQGWARAVTGKLHNYINFKVVMFMHFMLDVLDECGRLSQVFQRDTATLTTVHTALQRLELALSAMISRPAQHLHSFLENCVGESNTFQGVDLRGERDAEIERFSYVKTRIIHAILRFLESRFSSFDTSAVLKAGTIFDHKTWPEDRKELATFGEENLKCLLTHFRAPLEHNGCNLVAAEQEWLNMKIYIFHNLQMLQYTTLWQRMLNEYSEDYHNILMVVEIILVLPISTASCERGSSALKRIKNDWRSCLCNAALESLLRIVIDGPEVSDFDAMDTLGKWWNSSERSRRPIFHRNF